MPDTTAKPLMPVEVVDLFAGASRPPTRSPSPRERCARMSSSSATCPPSTTRRPKAGRSAVSRWRREDAGSAWIAARLFLSPHTVKEHASALYRKLEVRNRAEAVQRVQRLSLLT